MTGISFSAISLSKGIFVTSPEGIFIILNPALIALLKLSMEKTETHGITDASIHCFTKDLNCSIENSVL